MFKSVNGVRVEMPDEEEAEWMADEALRASKPTPKRGVTAEDLFLILRRKGQISDVDLPMDIETPKSSSGP